MSLPEARDGAFLYRDALFVEVGADKRHARASVPELKELLLSKKSKSTSAPKDQVGHWYEAQLVHYGLPSTKDKSAAKLRLIDAINAGQLSVPPSVQQLEAKLKKQYTGALRKAKLSAKKEAETVSAPKGKKRKASDPVKPTSVTKVSVKVGDLTFEIDHNSASAAESTTKRQKKAAPKEKTTTPKAARKKTQPSSTPATTKKQSSKATQNSSASSPAKKTQSRSSNNHPRPLQTARRSKPFSPSQTYSGRPPPVADETDSPPPPCSLYDFDEYDDDDHEYQDAERSENVVQVSGDYSLAIMNTAIDEHCSFQLYLSNSRDQLWGTFSIGPQSGIIRMDGIDGIAQSARRSFGWRAEHMPSGRLEFGKGCDGQLEFDGVGAVRGHFSGLMFGEDIEFEGQLEEDFAWHGEEEREDGINGLMQQWDEFPARAYRR